MCKLYSSLTKAAGGLKGEINAVNNEAKDGGDLKKKFRSKV